MFSFLTNVTQFINIELKSAAVCCLIPAKGGGVKRMAKRSRKFTRKARKLPKKAVSMFLYARAVIQYSK